nr:DUF6705 family protein [uncultured Flavobacterium sp.]
MKKIAIIAILLLSALQSSAQNIVPVEKAIDYRTAHKAIPSGTYLKDVNNLFAPYIGTWKGTINNKTYTFFITKITETINKGRSQDLLIIHHLIVDNMGSTLEDTRLSKALPHMRGLFFGEDLKYYSLHYTGGDNWACGRNGQVFVRKVNATTMLLNLNVYGEVIDIKRCPGGKMAEQILPTETPVTLVKQ